MPHPSPNPYPCSTEVFGEGQRKQRLVAFLAAILMGDRRSKIGKASLIDRRSSASIPGKRSRLSLRYCPDNVERTSRPCRACRLECPRSGLSSRKSGDKDIKQAVQRKTSFPSILWRGKITERAGAGLLNGIAGRSVIDAQKRWRPATHRPQCLPKSGERRSRSWALRKRQAANIRQGLELGAQELPDVAHRTLDADLAIQCLSLAFHLGPFE